MKIWIYGSDSGLACRSWCPRKEVFSRNWKEGDGGDRLVSLIPARSLGAFPVPPSVWPPGSPHSEQGPWGEGMGWRTTRRLGDCRFLGEVAANSAF